MEELLIIAIQGLFQLLIESIPYTFFDWLSWSTQNKTASDLPTIWQKAAILFVVGCILGSLSLLVIQHSFLTLPVLRVINLLAAPLFSAFLSKAIATRRSKTNTNIIARNHFWQAFWFTLGLVMVRFVYVEH